MKVSHIEHIGFAVRNLEEAIVFYEKTYGLKCYAIEDVPEQQVRTAFLLVGQTKIELLEPTSPDGPIGKFIAKRGEGFHHIAFHVDGLEETLRAVEDEGVRLIDSHPRKGAEGLQIAFLHPQSTYGVLTELCDNAAT
jgi:methylmalonyl-CoA/ethylmalonyl-CoA epimerase